jgi:hypothetical protein
LIVEQIANDLGGDPAPDDLHNHDESGTRRRHVPVIRAFLNIQLELLLARLLGQCLQAEPGLGLREKMGDRAVVGLGVGRRDRVTHRVARRGVAKPGLVAPTRRLVQTWAAEHHCRVERDQRGDQKSVCNPGCHDERIQLLLANQSECGARRSAGEGTAVRSYAASSSWLPEGG